MGVKHPGNEPSSEWTGRGSKSAKFKFHTENIISEEQKSGHHWSYMLEAPNNNACCLLLSRLSCPQSYYVKTMVHQHISDIISIFTIFQLMDWAVDMRYLATNCVRPCENRPIAKWQMRPHMSQEKSSAVKLPQVLRWICLAWRLLTRLDSNSWTAW